MRQYTLVAILLLVMALLIGCSSTVEAPAEGQASEPAQAAATQAPAADEAAPQPTETAAPAEATETPAGQEAGAEPAPTEAPPTAEPQPTATEAPQFNGQYEETFYRGLATAPITMIDYSDFL